jgi:diphthamide biosynthesis protein 3
MPKYDEIEIEDMTYDPETHTYSYPCPCGDRFKVSLEDLWEGDDIADCQSCTLFVTVIYEQENLPPLPDRGDDDDENEDTKESPAGDDSDTEDDSSKNCKELSKGDDDSAKIAVAVGELSISTTSGTSNAVAA